MMKLYCFEVSFIDPIASTENEMHLCIFARDKHRFSTLHSTTRSPRGSSSDMEAHRQDHVPPELSRLVEPQGTVVPRSFQPSPLGFSSVGADTVQDPQSTQQLLTFSGHLVPAHLGSSGAFLGGAPSLLPQGHIFQPQPAVQTPLQLPTSTFAYVPVDGAGQVSTSYATGTWATRNPGHPIIPVRSPRAPPTELTSDRDLGESRETAAADRAARRTKFEAAIGAFLEDQEARLIALAEEHNVTLKYARSIINLQSNFRPSRKPQLANALIHAKAQEVNKGRAHGERYTLAEIRKLVSEDLGMQNLTPQEEQAYITILEDHRETQKHGLRVNNAAAARDVLLTTSRIVKEASTVHYSHQIVHSLEHFQLDALRDRTGIYASLFVTRGHINDAVQSMWYGSDNTAVFWEDVFKHSAGDVARQYEQWACAQGHNLEERDSLANMRKQVTAYISNGLKMTTGKSSIAMNYTSYEASIIDTYGVRLVGWPNGVPFNNPSNIGTVGEIRKLRDALRSGECHWKKLSKNEREQFTKELESRQASGEQVRKPRKQRADTGRKRKGGTGNRDDARVQRRRTTSTQSAEVAEDIDDGDNDSEGDA